MRRVALLLGGAALLFSGGAAAARVHRVLLGRSVDGRPIVAIELGNPASPRKAHALSEPESRIAYRLLVRLRPTVSIWFHQHLDVVDESGASVSVERRFAALAGLRVARLTREPGSIVTWENERLHGGTAFVVELPAGFSRPAATDRFVRAIDAVATR